MNKFTKVLGASVLALASMTSFASDVTVGGVTWDTDWVDGGEQDFSLQYDFTQFFSSTSVGANSQTDMETAYSGAVGIADVIGSLTGDSSATGYYLSGLGEVYSINGSGSFCGSCELTLAFGGIGLNNNNTFDVSSAWISLLVDDSPDYSHPLSGLSEVGAAMDGQTWLTASFASFALIGGTVDNGLASAALQVTGGLAANNFLNSPLGGFALQSGSAFFNLFTNAKYSSLGNGQVISDTVSEPTTLAVFGLALLGLAGASRRKQS